MPAEFWSDEPEDSRSIEEIITGYSFNNHGPVIIVRELFPTGTRVMPGKDWGVNKNDNYKASKLTGDQARYSTLHKVGTIIGYHYGDSRDWVEVQWDNSTRDWYRAGTMLGTDASNQKLQEAYDLYLYQEEILVTSQNVKAGMKIKPSSMFGQGGDGYDIKVHEHYSKKFVGNGSGTIIELWSDSSGYEDYVYVWWHETGNKHWYKIGPRISGNSEYPNKSQFDLAIRTE